MKQNNVQNLLIKEVNRKEFILYASLLLLAVTGISGVWKNIEGIVTTPSKKGFGSGPYGK